MALRDVNVDGQKFSVSYELIRPSAERKILFLHGWGANKEIMKSAFGDLFEGFGLIFLDLPGFGKSSNDYILQTSDYAKITNEFLRLIDVRPYGVIGHSFGGKVSALLNLPHLALLGSSGIILPKPFFVRAKIAASKIAKAVGVNGALRSVFASDDAKDMSNVMYETFKNVVDEDFAHNFAKVTSNSVLVWGSKDTASPVIAGEQISKLINGSVFNVVNGDHFFFLSNKKLTADLIVSGWSKLDE